MKIRTTALTFLALAGLVAPLAAQLGVAGADATSTDPAPFRLSMPSVVTAYGGGGYAYTETSPRIVAGAEDFQLRATRASYADPIEVRWLRADGDVTLPADTMTRFYGLPDFFRTRVYDARGKRLVNRYRPFCPGYETQRVRPDAQAHNPYPAGCPYNPYTLGSVMGVPAGWATANGEDYQDFRLARGTYTMRTQVTLKYRDLFAIDDEADWNATSTLKVVGDPDYTEDRASQPRHGSTTRVRPTSPAAPAAPAARPAGTRPSGASGTPASGPRPDLRALPAFGMQVSRDGNYLQFAATVWNGGTSPLVVDGYQPADGDPDHLDAYQYFFDEDGNQTGYQPVGQMEWDPRPSHHHWHFEDFADYTLVTLDGGLAVKSQKEAFCLANTDAVDYTLPGADWHPDGTDLATACGDHDSLAVRESLAAGSGDTYDQYRAGQSFDLRKVPNGTYLVRVHANPEGNLVESDTTNDVSDRKVYLTGTWGHRKVTVAKVGIVDESPFGYEDF